MQHYAINTDHVTWEVADGEAVVLHFETSAYYALNSLGTHVWKRLAEDSTSVEKLAEEVAARYGKARGEVVTDIEAFLESLKAEDLVTDQAPKPGVQVRSPEEFALNGEYQPPQLTRFGELEKLILSGE